MLRVLEINKKQLMIINKNLKFYVVLIIVSVLVSCSSPEKNKKLYPEVSFKRVVNSKPQVLTLKKSYINRSESRSLQQKRNQINLKRLFRIYGPQAGKRIQDWKYTIIDYQRGSEIEKLTVANRFINSLEFVDDKIHWKKKDYWATPLETLASNGGDCEDFVIAKYYTLAKLGVSEQCLSLNYVKVKNYNKSHMVLIYQCSDQDKALVLDNLNPQLLTVKQRNDLISVYSFNQSGMWITDKQGVKRKLANIRHLSRWDDLQQRIKQENL